MLSWLTPVRPPALLVLVFHASPEADIDTWRRLEAEALGHLDEIQGMNIENASQAVGSVGLEIGAISIFGRLESNPTQWLVFLRSVGDFLEKYLVEVVVLPNQFLELRLYVDDSLGWELKLDHGHSSFFEML